MDEHQFQKIIELLDKMQRSLTMIRILAGITLGFLLSVSLARLVE